MRITIRAGARRGRQPFVVAAVRPRHLNPDGDLDRQADWPGKRRVGENACRPAAAVFGSGAPPQDRRHGVFGGFVHAQW